MRKGKEIRSTTLFIRAAVSQQKKRRRKRRKKKRSTEKLGVHLASYSLDRGLRTSAGNATIYSRQASGPLSIHCRNSNVMEFDPRAARLFLPPYFSSGGLSDPIGRRTSDPSFSDQPYLLSYQSKTESRRRISIVRFQCLFLVVFINPGNHECTS